jgi:hypothetical protein
MKPEELIKRLRQAHARNSLRTLGRECGVSHEFIRKLISGKRGISPASYQKIDEGLRRIKR